jgi:hypothetical protein
MWKEVESGSRYYPRIFLETLRKLGKTYQDSRCPGEDSNQAPLEQTSEAILHEPI